MALVIELAVPMVEAFVPDAWRKIDDIYLYGWAVIVCVELVGLAMAAWSRPALAIVAAIVAWVALPPSFVAKPVYAWLGLSGQTAWKVRSTSVIVHVAAFTVLAIVAALDAVPPIAQPARAAAGFRRVGSALWMRVIASVAVISITLLLVLGHAGAGAESILKLAAITAALVGLSSAAVFAIGTIGLARSNAPGVSSMLTIASAATTLWTGAVAVRQLPWLYSMLYGHSDYGHFTRDRVEAFTVVAPIVSIASVALLVIAIGVLASRRGDSELGAQASSRGVGYVALVGASIAMQTWMLKEVRSEGALVFWSLGLVVAALWGTALVAGLCTRAADALDREPGLPTARVVTGA